MQPKIILAPKNQNCQFKSQCKIDGYKSFKKNRDAFGGGFLVYVNEKLNCRSLESCLFLILSLIFCH